MTYRGFWWGALCAAIIYGSIALTVLAEPLPGFPVTLNGGQIPESANVVITVPSAGTASLVMQAYDADVPNEGVLEANGASVPLFSGDPLLTFPDTDANGVVNSQARNNVTVPVVVKIPVVAGENTLTFRHTSTGGFIIQSAEIAGITTATVPDPEPPPPIAELDGIAKQIQDSEWRLPGWWQKALLRGDWVIRLRTSTTPDWWYASIWDRETFARYTVRLQWPAVLAYFQNKREIDPSVPMQPLDLCDYAIVAGGDALKACAIVYASSTATSAYFYAEPITSSARVGKVAKGTSCWTWLYHAATQTAGLHWFRGTAPDTQKVGYVRCKDYSR